MQEHGYSHAFVFKFENRVLCFKIIIETTFSFYLQNDIIKMRMIKNYEQLNTTDFRKKILDVINTGLKQLDTRKVIQKQISLKGNLLTIKSEKEENEKYDLKDFSNLFVVAIGKGSLDAAERLEKILGSKIKKGIALDTKKKKLQFIDSYKGTHPLPSKKNVKATKKIVKLINQADSKDLILFFVFGGGSALLCSPAKISVKKLEKYNQQLISSGKDIYQINTVRKHLSLVKGGQLAKLAYPAKIVSCIFSDVPGNNLGFIASGPTVKDQTGKQDAWEIGREFGWPKNIFTETPKEDKYFKNIDNILLFSNYKPLNKMKQKAEQLGLNAEIHSLDFKGEAREAGKELLQELKDKKTPQVILAGGETTVEVIGKGKGGRNQEVVLGALPFLENKELIACLSSDGRDNTEAAGAIGDIETKKKAQQLGLNQAKHLKQNDSFHFFQKTGDLIFTERGTNVADLIVIAKSS